MFTYLLNAMMCIYIYLFEKLSEIFSAYWTDFVLSFTNGNTTDHKLLLTLLLLLFGFLNDLLLNFIACHPVSLFKKPSPTLGTLSIVFLSPVHSKESI